MGSVFFSWTSRVASWTQGYLKKGSGKRKNRGSDIALRKRLRPFYDLWLVGTRLAIKSKDVQPNKCLLKESRVCCLFYYHSKIFFYLFFWGHYIVQSNVVQLGLCDLGANSCQLYPKCFMTLMKIFVQSKVVIWAKTVRRKKTAITVFVKSCIECTNVSELISYWRII